MGLTLAPLRKSFRSAFSFAARAHHYFDQLSVDEILMRGEQESKRLLEEVLPMASFALHVAVPDRAVALRYAEPNEAFDGEIMFAGPEVEQGLLEPKYYIEVTSAIDPKDYLKREAMHRNGSVFGGSLIRRVGSRTKGGDRIVSQAEARDPERDVHELISQLASAVARKAGMDYPDPCILLVRIQPERWLDYADQATVARASPSLPFTRQFKHRYVVWPAKNIVIGV